jgi:hypothetical protein
VFFMQTADRAGTDCSRIGPALEEELHRNFHYHHARSLAQLQPLRVFRVDGDAAGAYRRFLMRKGAKAGDIKFNVLSAETGCLSAFEGRLEEEFLRQDAKPPSGGNADF